MSNAKPIEIELDETLEELRPEDFEGVREWNPDDGPDEAREALRGRSILTGGL